MAKKGYWIVFYDSVSDASALGDYSKAAGPALQAAGGRVLAAGKPTKIYESGADQKVVLIEFDSVEKAIAAHDGEAYQATLKIFNNAALRDVRIVEGL
jgi:uncharacterized protein (DUF1330 family)